MSEQADDADLDALMARIRGELAARRLGDDAGARTAPPSAASWAHQVAIDTTRRRYSIGELLRLHDAAFLRAAYLALLGREPDAVAWTPTLARLRRLEISRTEVLRALAASPEGRARGVVVDGLATRLLGLRITRLPGLRSLVAMALASRRPRLRARQQEPAADLAPSRRRQEHLGAVVEDRHAPSESSPSRKRS